MIPRGILHAKCRIYRARLTCFWLRPPLPKKRKLFNQSLVFRSVPESERRRIRGICVTVVRSRSPKRHRHQQPRSSCKFEQKLSTNGLALVQISFARTNQEEAFTHGRRDKVALRSKNCKIRRMTSALAVAILATRNSYLDKDRKEPSCENNLVKMQSKDHLSSAQNLSKSR